MILCFFNPLQFHTHIHTLLSFLTYFFSEPRDVFAVANLTTQQKRTKNAEGKCSSVVYITIIHIGCLIVWAGTSSCEDHGRLPIWNETFKFNIQEQDQSQVIHVEVYNFDELLGVARYVHSKLCKLMHLERLELSLFIL